MVDVGDISRSRRQRAQLCGDPRCYTQPTVSTLLRNRDVKYALYMFTAATLLSRRSLPPGRKKTGWFRGVKQHRPMLWDCPYSRKNAYTHFELTSNAVPEELAGLYPQHPAEPLSRDNYQRGEEGSWSLAWVRYVPLTQDYSAAPFATCEGL